MKTKLKEKGLKMKKVYTALMVALLGLIFSCHVVGAQPLVGIEQNDILVKMFSYSDKWREKGFNREQVAGTNATFTRTVYFPDSSPSGVEEITTIGYYSRQSIYPPNNRFVFVAGEEIEVFGVNRRTGVVTANTNLLSFNQLPIYEQSLAVGAGEAVVKSTYQKSVQTFVGVYRIDNTNSGSAYICEFRAITPERPTESFDMTKRVEPRVSINWAPSLREARQKTSGWTGFKCIITSFSLSRIPPFEEP